MTSESSQQQQQQQPARLQNMATRPLEPENLPCPRCDSTKTKFCYYNNYNLSQPRYFCRSCRRYWTRGGSLRNVPVGGGTRNKGSNNKRSRSIPTTTAAAAATTTSSPSSSTVTNDPIPGNPVTAIPKMNLEMGFDDSVDLKESAAGGFTSLLNLNAQQRAGFLPFGGFGFGFGLGLGLHSGLNAMGVGTISTWDWPIEQYGEGNGGGNVVSGGAASGCNTWQTGGVEGGLSDGDDFVWPDLAISAPVKSLK